jgi:hypothetical protein
VSESWPVSVGALGTAVGYVPVGVGSSWAETLSAAPEWTTVLFVAGLLVGAAGTSVLRVASGYRGVLGAATATLATLALPLVVGGFALDAAGDGEAASAFALLFAGPLLCWTPLGWWLLRSARDPVSGDRAFGR